MSRSRADNGKCVMFQKKLIWNEIKKISFVRCLKSAFMSFKSVFKCLGKYLHFIASDK